VAIISYNPHPSRTFYKGKYVEGSTDKPDCYSDDGIAPAADAETPQATKCATCPQNVWGSRKTEDGRDAKACSETRRLAIVSTSRVDDPMLLRVPTTSQKALGEYQALLASHKAPIQGVVTRIKFDHEKAYPSLLFEPVGFVDEETAEKIAEQADSLLVKQIIGVSPVEAKPAPVEALTHEPEAAETVDEPEAAEAVDEPEDEPEEKPAPKPAAKKKVAKKKAAKKRPEPEVVEEDDAEEDDITSALDAVFGN